MRAELTNEGQDELTNEGQDKSTLSQTRVKMNRLHRILTLHGVSRSMFLHVRLCVLGEGRTKSEQPPNYPNRDLRTPNRDLRTPNAPHTEGTIKSISIKVPVR